MEVLLDPRLDAVVRDEWSRLLEAGVGSQGRVRAESNRPHVTLFVAGALPTEFDDALRAVLPPRPLAVRLGGVVVFGSRHATLARTVVPSIALLELHARVFEILAGCPGIPAHIRPGAWTPHVTLARRVPVARIGVALAATQTPETRLAGASGGVRRWDGESRREWSLT